MPVPTLGNEQERGINGLSTKQFRLADKFRAVGENPQKPALQPQILTEICGLALR
jgi:hypothetical protein